MKNMGTTDGMVKCNCYKTAVDIDKKCLNTSPNISINKTGSLEDDMPSSPRPRTLSNGSAIKSPTQLTFGSPHHLITGHANSSRSVSTHSRCNSGTILQCTCVLNSCVHASHNNIPPQSPRLSDVTTFCATPNSGNVSPKPTSIFVTEKSSEFITRPLKMPSPHSDIGVLSSILADCEGKKSENRIIHSEKASPNFSDTYQLPGVTNKSRSCLVYEPTDPWTKRTDDDKKSIKNICKANHRSLEEQSNDPWINNITASSSQRQLYHQSRSLTRNDDFIQNKQINNTLTIPSQVFDKHKTRPKLQRSKTPLSDDTIHNNDSTSSIQDNESNVSPSRKQKTSLERLQNSLEAHTCPTKLITKSPKFCRVLSKTSISPESDNCSLLPDKVMCTCDHRRSPKSSPRRLSPNLGYKSLSNDLDNGRSLCQNVEQAVAHCARNEYSQNFHSDYPKVEDQYILSENPKSPKIHTTNFCPKMLGDKTCVNKIDGPISSPVREKHKELHNNSDPLLETRC